MADFRRDLDAHPAFTEVTAAVDSNEIRRIVASERSMS